MALCPQPSDLWRFEHKYLLNRFQYLQVKNAITPYVVPDSFTSRAAGRGYTVRSLYYDSADYAAYREKIEGNFARVKLRLRTYATSAEINPPIRVELKTRQGAVMVKYESFANYQDYTHFMQHRHWPENDDPVRSEFERLVRLHSMEPKVIVQYQREGYEPRGRDNFRLTFDHNVCSAAARTLFPDNLFFHRHNSFVVLEIKCREKSPRWLQHLVKIYGLKVVANSKYVQGVEAACLDAYTRTWSYG